MTDRDAAVAKVFGMTRSHEDQGVFLSSHQDCVPMKALRELTALIQQELGPLMGADLMNLEVTDAAVDRVMDVAISGTFVKGTHMHSYGGASQNRDCRSCAALRAAVEQAIADAYMQGWRDRFNEPIAKAELERQRGAQ